MADLANLQVGNIAYPDYNDLQRSFRGYSYPLGAIDYCRRKCRNCACADCTSCPCKNCKIERLEKRVAELEGK